MMFFGLWWAVALAGACAAERWRWEDGARAASVRIDTKVRFIDDEAGTRQQQRYNQVQADEIKQPTQTDGFYNRPPGAGSGRFPVHSEPLRQKIVSASRDGSRRLSDGTLDSLQYCKCVSTPECTPRTDLPQACAAGMFLCCYKRPSKADRQYTEFFNEVDDERPMLLPSHQNRGGPFPAAPAVLAGPNGPTGVIGPRQDSRKFQNQQPILVGPEGPSGNIGPRQDPRKFEDQRPILVGPDGPSGVIGPNQRNPGVLVGPGGPSGVVGPNYRDDRVLAGPGGAAGSIGPNQPRPAVLVGPEGPTGHIGPQQSSKSGILVGPDGPTGQIGPEETAQRGVFVGPGGSTGVLGPRQYGQRQVLIGPGGPTGMIGPGGRAPRRQGVLTGPGGPTGMIGPYGQQTGRSAHLGVLVGPGGPTGIIGPGRRLLVGPGGPTGHIGPRGYGQFGF